MNQKTDATFVVHITNREHHSWHGQVTWSETAETVSFRSAVELMNLMETALGDEEEESEEK